MAVIVVALGGNAILQPGQKGEFKEQYDNVAVAARSIVELLKLGHRVVVTHGNGPQVGNILIQNEEAGRVVPAMPLDVCGAESQGLIGYMLQQNLYNLITQQGIGARVATIITQVEVSPEDRAFANPTKPIGPFYTAEQARELEATRGYTMREDAGRGWRRVVPSPQPIAICEKDAIKLFVNSGFLVIASGGGGIPVVRNSSGLLTGVEAVIDKDLAAECLAEDVEADLLMIMTDVERVCLNYGKPEQVELARLSLGEARAYQVQGHFKAGSMGPKVEAALRFVERGGGKAIISSLAHAIEALNGTSGTVFTR